MDGVGPANTGKTWCSMRDLCPAPGLPPARYMWHSRVLSSSSPNSANNQVVRTAVPPSQPGPPQLTQDTEQPLLFPQIEDSPLPLLLCSLAPGPRCGMRNILLAGLGYRLTGCLLGTTGQCGSAFSVPTMGGEPHKMSICNQTMGFRCTDAIHLPRKPWAHTPVPSFVG